VKKVFKGAILAVVLVTLGLTEGCFDNNGGGQVTETGNPNLETSAEILGAGSIRSAMNSYTELIEGAGMISDEVIQAYFGRSLCKLILLMEEAPLASILENFGQSEWLSSTVFTNTGYLYQSFYNPPFDMSAFPFSERRHCNMIWLGKINRCLLTNVTEGYTAEDIASSLLDLMVYVDDIIDDLEVAISNDSVNFTIPKELFTGDRDIMVNHSDMLNILASMYYIKAAVDFANSWRFDIDLSDLVNENGEAFVTALGFTNMLNEQFALRDDNRLIQARTNIQTGIVYSMNGIEEILDGAENGILNLKRPGDGDTQNDENQSLYEELYDALDLLNESFAGVEIIAPILPSLELTLENFFDNPIDASELEIDPFVYDEGIKAVEGFWQQYLNQIFSDYTIGDELRVFSDKIKEVNRPFFQIFEEMKGRRFGSHTIN